MVCIMTNYFTDRKQSRPGVKVGLYRSKWLPSLKGTPQGSILGTYMLNILVTELVYMMNSTGNMYNNTDDMIE